MTQEGNWNPRQFNDELSHQELLEKIPPPNNVDNNDTKSFLLNNGDIDINRVESNKAATGTVSKIHNPKPYTATKIVTPCCY